MRDKLMHILVDDTLKEGLKAIAMDLSDAWGRPVSMADVARAGMIYVTRHMDIDRLVDIIRDEKWNITPRD